MNYNELNSILAENAHVDSARISNDQFKMDGLTFIKLRDILYSIGKIIFEDTDNKVYVAQIKGGIAKGNTAFTAINLVGDTIITAIYAREGIIKQHTKEAVLYELKLSLKNYIVQE